MIHTLRRPLALALLATGLPAVAVAQNGMSAGGLVVEPARPEPAGPPFASASLVEYLYDDGTASVNVGPPSSFDPDMLWGNYYYTTPGGEVITEIAVAFGSTFPSAATEPVTFWLLNDPDADGDVRNATAVASADTMVTLPMPANTFVRVPIPPTPVGGAFFVGASAFLQGGEDRPAREDTDAAAFADRAWLFYAPDIAAVINNLASAPFGTRMNQGGGFFPGAFMIRATGQPATTTATDGAPSGADVELRAAGPNPVAGATALRFVLPAAADVTLDVVDALGRRVAVLAAGAYAAGPHAVRWDAAGVAPGVYVGRLQAGAAVRTVRLAVAP